MMKIYITNLGKYNEGSLIGEWLELPATQEELQDTYKKIGINEQYEEMFITDYECDFMKIEEYASINNLNEIAELLDGLNENEEKTAKAIIEWGYYNDIKEAIENVEDFNLYEDINNDDDLGNYWLFDSGCYEVPENLKSYIDTEKWGRDYRLNEEGYFSEYGWIERA